MSDVKVHAIDFVAVCGVKVRPDVFEVLSESRKVDGGSGKSSMLLVISRHVSRQSCLDS
ncbi:MAG: hypothetical protein NWF13_00235 [Candidatus Bathyarchaeota archaeon]|nr:hypothetical protein [Candidatus Bathyarchaeota archaeon]